MRSAIKPEASTLVDLLIERAQDSAQRTAYTFLEDGEEIGERVTYEEFGRRVLSVAAYLQDRFRPGDRLLLLYPPCIEYMAAFFACACAGVIAVPLFPPRGTKRNLRLESVAHDCAPRAALTAGRRSPQMAVALQASPGLAHLPLICTDEIPTADGHGWQWPDIEPDSISFLQYTSGSTGDPKGVMVSHANLLANEYMIAASFGAHSESKIVTWLPIYHDMGLIGQMLQSFWLGSECIFMAPVAFLQRPIRWLDAITKFGARVSGGPNFAYDLCVDKIPPAQRVQLDLSTWKVAFNGAEPVRHATIERFADAFADYGFARTTSYPCYGMAESTLMASGGELDQTPAHLYVDRAQLGVGHIVKAKGAAAQCLVSSGAAVPGQTIRIVDPVSFEACPPRVVGEIWLAGENIAPGYWNRAEVNVAIFGAHIATSNEGPFLRTGDLGFLDGEELYITGRMKDVIIVRGANHYPQDIEATVESADASINAAGVAAFGINDDSGERVVVVAEIARTSLRRLDEPALAARVRQHVMEQREVLLNDVVFIRPGTLPKSSSGKVQRSRCRAFYLSQQLDLVSARCDVAAEDA